MGYETAPLPEQCATTAKTSEWERAGHKTGGPGGLPPALFLPISREKWGPRRAGGPPGALRPEAPEKPRPPEGYAVPYRSPAQDRAGTHVAGSNLQRSQKGPPTDSRGPRPHLGDPTGPTLRRSGRDPLSSEKDPKPLGGLGSFPRLLYRCCWGNRNPHPWSQAKRRTLLASTWPPPS